MFSSSHNAPSLSEVFVFCPSLCTVEGDEYMKILFYYPEDRSLNEQLNSVGLCEAVLSFTRYFASPCHSLHTDRTKQFFHEISQDVWLVMTVSLATHNGNVTELNSSWMIDTLDDHVMKAVLSNASENFKLFTGSVDAILECYGVEGLKSRFTHFFSRYLRFMLPEQCDLLDCFHGVEFGPVAPTNFLQAHALISRIRYAFRCVEDVAFFFDGQVVQSTLKFDVLCRIYYFLNTFVFSENVDACHVAVPNKSGHLGHYIIGPKNLNDPNEQIHYPHICHPGDRLPSVQLVVYRALRAVLCLFIRGCEPISSSFFRQFDAMVGPRLTLLADRMACNCQSTNSLPDSVLPLGDEARILSGIVEQTLPPTSLLTSGGDRVSNTVISATAPSQSIVTALSLLTGRFVYWNSTVGTAMSTLHVFTGSGRRRLNGAHHLLMIMAQLREELMSGRPVWHKEISVHLTHEFWIVARLSNGREIYMVLGSKKGSLTRLKHDLRRLHTTTFRGLLVLE